VGKDDGPDCLRTHNVMIKAKVVVEKVSWSVDWPNHKETHGVAGKIGLCALVIVRV
jgi:hypothetical protein